MRKVVLFAHISLDGFAGDVNGSHDFMSFDEELEQYAEELIKTVGVSMYGRNTYYLMEGYWPNILQQPDASRHALELARWFQDIPKIVFSKTMNCASWNNTTQIKENVEGKLNQLKGQPGKDLVIFGSPVLARSLMKLGMIDEYQLAVHPVILGNGISLFGADLNTSKLKLLASKMLGSGVVTLHYEALKVTVDDASGKGGV
jgi:dihydrofolate reductase